MSKENKEEQQPELDQNTPCKLELPLGSVNYILEMLSTKPYKETAGLIGMIHQQVIPQVQSKTTPAQ